MMARSVTVEGWDAALSDVARQTGALVPDLLERLAEVSLAEIRPRWPVGPNKRGRVHSRDALHVERVGDEVAIVCDVYWARFIHEGGLRGPTYIVRIVDYVAQNMGRLAPLAARRG